MLTSAGMLLATALPLAREALSDVLLSLIAIVSVLVLVFTRLDSLRVILGSAIVCLVVDAIHISPQNPSIGRRFVNSILTTFLDTSCQAVFLLAGRSEAVDNSYMIGTPRSGGAEEARRYGTGSGSDLVTSKSACQDITRSLPLPVPYHSSRS